MMLVDHHNHLPTPSPPPPPPLHDLGCCDQERANDVGGAREDDDDTEDRPPALPAADPICLGGGGGEEKGASLSSPSRRASSPSKAAAAAAASSPSPLRTRRRLQQLQTELRPQQQQPLVHPPPPPRRGSSFREQASSAAKTLFNTERRGSLKAFASSLLERKGSFNRSTPPRRVASSRINGSSGNLQKFNSEDAIPNVTSSDVVVEARLQKPDPKESPSLISSSSPPSPMTRLKGSSSAMRGLAAAAAGLEKEEERRMAGGGSHGSIREMKQVDFDNEYDILQKIGEGWFSRVYLTELRSSRQEIVLKAISAETVSADDFLREFRHARLLSAHRNVLTALDVAFRTGAQYMFATEHAPLGDLTSNVPADHGVGEMSTKRVARQIGAALEFVHAKNLCHLDVKLDNILVFKSDFSWVKLCDFGSVRGQGDIVIKKNELLPYCPPELVARRANEYYQVDRVQDVFQFGVVVFFCLFASLPWQRADTTDPNFADFVAWRSKRSGSKPPKSFKPMTSRAQKLFRKLMDVDPSKRLLLSELAKYTEDKWLKKPGKLHHSEPLAAARGGKGMQEDPRGLQLSDGVSQLTMGSFRSVHSNAVEKNRILFTLMQHGVETTVDRSQKNSRIINWIQHGHAQEHLLQAESAAAKPDNE